MPCPARSRGSGGRAAALGRVLIVVTFAIGAWANLVRTPERDAQQRHLLGLERELLARVPAAADRRSCWGCRRWSRSSGPRTTPTSRRRGRAEEAATTKTATTTTRRRRRRRERRRSDGRARRLGPIDRQRRHQVPQEVHALRRPARSWRTARAGARTAGRRARRPGGGPTARAGPDRPPRWPPRL